MGLTLCISRPDTGYARLELNHSHGIVEPHSVSRSTQRTEAYAALPDPFFFWQFQETIVANGWGRDQRWCLESPGTNCVNDH